MRTYAIKQSEVIQRWVWLTAWILALSVRFCCPLADAPADLSWSGGYMADEGFWVHNARNTVLFGDPQLDQWNNKAVSPLLHYPVLWLFRIMGTGLLTVRVWAAILALISLIFLDRITRRVEPHGWLFLAFAVNSVLVGYQRIAILECAVIPVSLLCMWCWLLGREKSNKHAVFIDVITGITAAGVWMIKATQIYIIPVILIATWLAEPRLQRALKAIIYQLAGLLSVFSLWYVFVRLPNNELLAQYNAFYLSQQGSSLNDLVGNLVKQPVGIYFSRLPVLFPAAILSAVQLLFKRNFKLLPPVVIFASVWLFCCLLSFSAMGYRPMRYYLPTIIPIVILGWRYLSQNGPDLKRRSLRIMTTGVLLVVLFPDLLLMMDRYIFEGELLRIPNVAGFPVVSPIICVITTLVIVFFYLFKTESDQVRKRVLTGLICLSIVFHISVIGKRMLNRRYDIITASRYLKKELPENAVLAGQWAPELCLETGFRAVPVWWGFVNWEEPFQKYGITHMVAWEYALGNELKLQEKWFPDVMRDAEKLTTFRIKESDVSVWRITN